MVTVKERKKSERAEDGNDVASYPGPLRVEYIPYRHAKVRLEKATSWEAHHERAQIPYPDITGMHLAPDIKISGHIHGHPKCQISLKLACFFTLVATASNFLRCWTLPGVCNLLFINRCMRPEGPWQRLAAAFADSSGVFIHSLGRCLVRPFMVYYVEYNALQHATGLWGLIWSHTVSSSMCGGRPVGVHMVAYGPL